MQIERMQAGHASANPILPNESVLRPSSRSNLKLLGDMGRYAASQAGGDQKGLDWWEPWDTRHLCEVRMGIISAVRSALVLHVWNIPCRQGACNLSLVDAR